MTRKVIRISDEAYKLVTKWNKIINKQRKARGLEPQSEGETADALVTTGASRRGSLAKDAEKNRSKGASKPKAAKKVTKASTKKAPKKAAAKKVTTKKVTKPRTAKKSKLSSLASKRSGAPARA
ncbi:MAG: hypothetical protein DRQ64_00360 [Gammaproteobacteria bacterium]|nr:MAG: hypothetical protein DRQ64_00360 [Gammaproteobacteria bacterium]